LSGKWIAFNRNFHCRIGLFNVGLRIMPIAFYNLIGAITAAAPVHFSTGFVDIRGGVIKSAATAAALECPVIIRERVAVKPQFKRVPITGVLCLFFHYRELKEIQSG
jgi:hypothetical protein